MHENTDIMGSFCFYISTDQPSDQPTIPPNITVNNNNCSIISLHWPFLPESRAALGSRLELFVSICWAFWTIFAHNTVPLPALTTEQRCCCSGQKYMADSVHPSSLPTNSLPIGHHICLFPPVMEWAVNLAPEDHSDPFSFSISICSLPTSCPADVFIADILVWWRDRQKTGRKAREGRSEAARNNGGREI